MAFSGMAARNLLRTRQKGRLPIRSKWGRHTKRWWQTLTAFPATENSSNGCSGRRISRLTMSPGRLLPSNARSSPAIRRDKFKQGNANALSDSAKRGWDIYQKKANCIACHAGFNLTDNNYHNLGVGLDKPDPDLGRYVVTKMEEDKGRFKTPTLREITYTGPYM